MHDSAYADARHILTEFLPSIIDATKRLKVVDIGSCDVNGTLRPLIPAHWYYTGCDVAAGPNVNVVLSSPYDWPELREESFDLVVSTQVAEHVPHPWRWIREVARIIKPGGFLYISTPNTMHFHEYPIDCWRVWPDGMRALMDEARLSVIKCYANSIDTSCLATKPKAAEN